MTLKLTEAQREVLELLRDGGMIVLRWADLVDPSARVGGRRVLADALVSDPESPRLIRNQVRGSNPRGGS